MNYTIRNLLVAALLMIAGIVLVTSFIRQERRDLSRGKQEIVVYVAAKDIPAGTSTKEMENGGYLETKDVLREDAPPNAVGKLSSIKDLVSNETIYKGDYVTFTAFDKSTGIKPTAQIKGNERLMSLPILSANDVGGLVRPGDHIDLVASQQVQTPDGQKILTSIIARDIEIIETPESLQPDGTEAEPEAPEADGDPKLYVIKATDEELANIVFAQSAADEFKVYMLLRGANGDADTKIPPMLGPDLGTVKGAKAVGQPTPDPAQR